ncbi:hypothetical protein BDR04DRAFT_1123131 [Suillus decipiens]|nr:hypothetical protein BDR04DRAFT_1123131 [Suillus decipiens]
MATSASFHGVVGLQNGSRYQIKKKNYWHYNGFIATPEMGDICVNVFTFGANAASVEDSIYLLDARTTVGPIIDDNGKSAHSLHLFTNDDLQPLPDGAHAFPTVIIAGKVSCSAFSLKQENEFDVDISQYVTAPQQNIKHVIVQGTMQGITAECCTVTVKDIALGPSDMVTSVDDNSETVPLTTLKQFDWGGTYKEKGKAKGKGKGKKEGTGESGKRTCDDDADKDIDDDPSTAGSSKVITCESTVFVKIQYMQLKNVLSIINQYNMHYLQVLHLYLKHIGGFIYDIYHLHLLFLPCGIDDVLIVTLYCYPLKQIASVVEMAFDLFHNYIPYLHA